MFGKFRPPLLKKNLNGETRDLRADVGLLESQNKRKKLSHDTNSDNDGDDAVSSTDARPYLLTSSRKPLAAVANPVAVPKTREASKESLHNYYNALW